MHSLPLRMSHSSTSPHLTLNHREATSLTRLRASHCGLSDDLFTTYMHLQPVPSDVGSSHRSSCPLENGQSIWEIFVGSSVTRKCTSEVRWLHAMSIRALAHWTGVRLSKFHEKRPDCWRNSTDGNKRTGDKDTCSAGIVAEYVVLDDIDAT